MCIYIYIERERDAHIDMDIATWCHSALDGGGGAAGHEVADGDEVVAEGRGDLSWDRSETVLYGSLLLLLLCCFVCLLVLLFMFIVVCPDRSETEPGP